MMCAGLGDAKGALLLSTARQGTCFIPFVHLISYLFKAVGVASVQAVADLLSLVLAIPVLVHIQKKLTAAEKELQEQPAVSVSPVLATEAE